MQCCKTSVIYLVDAGFEGVSPELFVRIVQVFHVAENTVVIVLRRKYNHGPGVDPCISKHTGTNNTENPYYCTSTYQSKLFCLIG